MQCHEFRRQADGWMEGQRHSDAAAHLSGCPQCRALIADLQAIEAAARQLVEGDVHPPERLWIAIRAQLESEGLVESRGWAERFADLFRGLPRPALAGAYVSFLIVAAVLLGLQSNIPLERPVLLSGAPSAIVSLRADLADVEQRTVSAMHSHNPAVMDSYRENLAIVDNFIALCEKTVRDKPGNELAREYLYAAYQQKAEVLATMVERGVMGD